MTPRQTMRHRAALSGGLPSVPANQNMPRLDPRPFAVSAAIAALVLAWLALNASGWAIAAGVLGLWVVCKWMGR